jgi:hypothetical protein
MAAYLRGFVAARVATFRDEREVAVHRKKVHGEKNRLEKLEKEARQTKNQKRRKAICRVLLLVAMVTGVAVATFFAYFFKFVINIYLILKGTIAVDTDAYEEKMDKVLVAVNTFLSENTPDLEFLYDMYDWLYHHLLSLLDKIEVGFTAGVTCDGQQSPVYLAINFLIVGAIIMLFDSTLYVFLSVAINDYMYDPENKRGKKPRISNKVVELVSKTFMYGCERQFKNFVQII